MVEVVELVDEVVVLGLVVDVVVLGRVVDVVELVDEVVVELGSTVVVGPIEPSSPGYGNGHPF